MGVAIDAGALDQRVTLQQRGVSVSALGENTAAWSDVATLWAQAQPLRGREYFASGQMQQATDVRFRIRWRSGVDTTMRIVWRGQPHDIVSVIDVDGARTMLEVMCITGVRDGRA